MKNLVTKMKRRRAAGRNHRDVGAKKKKWTRNNVLKLRKHRTKRSKVEPKRRATICSLMGRNRRVSSRRPKCRARVAHRHGTGKKRAITVHLMSLPKKPPKHQLTIHLSV